LFAESAAVNLAVTSTVDSEEVRYGSKWLIPEMGPGFPLWSSPKREADK
jgi:hypothetical protein